MSEQEPERENIEPGQTWEHIEGGEYKVLFFSGNAEDASKFELTGELSAIPPFVAYMQLSDGKIRPAGSVYVRPEENFRENMRLVHEEDNDSSGN